LSFGINASGLSAGTYTSTVTASAEGYTSATLKVTLTVTAAKALSFSPTSLSFSVIQNGTTANKSSTLSANMGTPVVSLAKSATWVVLPAPALGSLFFGINSSGLAVGTYTATVTASATGYISATMQVTLTVMAKRLSFSPASLSFSVVQNGTTANKFSTLSANTGTPTVTLTRLASWVVLPPAALGSLSFGISSSGLAPGTYNATVTASATGYTSAALQVSLTITTNAIALNIKVNFQDSATITPSGWLRDYGQAYGPRTSALQGSGYSFGWLTRSDNSPLDLTRNGRNRGTPPDTLLATLMHMQGDDLATFNGTAIEGIWQAKIANGKYDISVSVGDQTQVNSIHSINVEGISAISGFVPTSTQKFKSASVTVSVADGFLTIDAIGGTNTKINWITIRPARPAVVSVNPPKGAVSVNENTSISTDILKLPNGGINNATITSSTVYLTENATGALVPANVNGTGGGDAITLVPASVLKLSTTYKFNVTSGVKDLSGAAFLPYSSTFTTVSTATTNTVTAQFKKISLPNAVGRHSSLTIGPDGKLYALTIDGIIKRFSINNDGTLGIPQLIYSLQDAYGSRTPRLAIGFAFDPSSTPTNLVVWITHESYLFLNAPDWDGRLAKLSGANLQTVQDVLINLPRSAKDHVTNSIAFGPDGALYFTQGSTSAMGRADPTWSNRNEHLLSCSVLRLDVSKLGTLPLNVKTHEGGGTYNPYATNAPLTIYASGVRNAYDLVWHSNGSLYVPTNGSAAGGNTPASVNGTLRPDGTTYNGPSVPALTNVQQTMDDYLFRVVKGGYYGHPDSLRGEYVMNGGNPTSAVDVAEVSSYPVGTLPDVNWRGSAFDFRNNASPDGAIEYKSNTFNGALKGKLLVVRYSQHDDIITLTPGTNKDIVSATEGNSIPGFSGFIDPLDLIEDVRNGNIYVSEYGGDSGKITLLKPDTTTNLSSVQIANKTVFVPNDHPNTIPGCDEVVEVAIPTVNEVLAQTKINSSQKLRVNPNPVLRRFNIVFPEKYEGDYKIQIVNLYGKKYELAKIHLNGGGSNMQLDISRLLLNAGIYFLQVSSQSNKTEIVKLIVL
jgi:glucose/arabinose dehydrogenase